MVAISGAQWIARHPLLFPNGLDSCPSFQYCTSGIRPARTVPVGSFGQKQDVDKSDNQRQRGVETIRQSTADTRPNADTFQRVPCEDVRDKSGIRVRLWSMIWRVLPKHSIVVPSVGSSVQSIHGSHQVQIYARYLQSLCQTWTTSPRRQATDDRRCVAPGLTAHGYETC